MLDPGPAIQLDEPLLSLRKAYLQRTSPSCDPPNDLQFCSVFSVPGALRLPLWTSVNLGLFLSGSSPDLQPGASGDSQGGGAANAAPAPPNDIVSAIISAA